MATERPCVGCGERFTPRRSAKTCSVRCQKRVQRGMRAAPVVELPAQEEQTESGDVTRATTAVLESADRLDTPLGRLALNLAHRLDEGRDTGQGAASVSRELRVTLDAALAGAAEAENPLDELKAFRERKRSAAG